MEEKMEKILRTVLKVQTSIISKENNNEIHDAIASIRKEIESNPDKVLSK